MRTRLSAAAATGLMLVAAVAAAQQPKKPEIKEQSLRTKDGWSLPATYFSVPSKDTPVVILLHGRDGNQGVWRGLAEQLQQARFAVLTLDLRKHGESQPPMASRSTKVTPADYQGMVKFDLEAAKDFLIGEHNAENLNIRKLAVVAADDMAPVAANWAEADWFKEPYPDAPTFEARTPRGQDVRALVFLSPTEGIGGLNLGRALPRLKNPAFNVAALVAVGELDKDDRKAAEKSYERLAPPEAGGEEKRVFLERYPQVKARGAELLGATRGRAQQQILGFLDKYVKQLPDKWQNRKSRLE